MQCPILRLAKKIIRCRSISPNDAGCQKIIIDKLKSFGFVTESIPIGNTDNLWAWKGKGRTLVFVGHTDVVPPGNLSYWTSHPFVPTVYNGVLYGRGAVDMKGSLAAMIIAVERFVKNYPFYYGRIAFLITSDEEADAKNGTVKVIEKLVERKEQINYCLIGEPSSNKYVGDVIKYGRRGSLTADLLLYGIQEHVAYSNSINNPLHQGIYILKELIETEWSLGNFFFPPTTIQIIDIYSNNNSHNMTPDTLRVKFNFRFGNEISDTYLKKKVESVIQKYDVKFQINWILSAEPFLAPRGELVEATVKAIEYYQRFSPRLETTGGTSDGRFISRFGIQIVELGLVNSNIHKINEHVKISDLQLLSKIYQNLIERLLLCKR